MKIPKRIKIVANTSGNVFYDKYIGKEYDVLDYDEEENSVYLETPSDFVGVERIWWISDEYVILECEDGTDKDADIVTITRAEYEELLDIEAKYIALNQQKESEE